MQGNDGQSVLPAHERAQASLRAGEPARARAEAHKALDEHGPHAGLYAVLGRAHEAEDDDDHDAAAERAYRAGLDAFPDDLDLLAAYAEFGLAGDLMERPGRVARGRRAADRLRELAPDSPQALRIGEVVAGGSTGRRTPSPGYVQRHDVRAALTNGAPLDAAAGQAREAADAWPHDRRLAVRAETLAALAEPKRHRRLIATMLRHPYRTALVLCAAVAAWLPTVPALGLPWQYCLCGLVVSVPVRMERSLLRRARRRAEQRLPAGYAAPAPGAPDIPPPTRRERTALALALVMVAGSVFGSVGWQYVRSTQYPHYVAVVPRSFHGIALSADDPMGDYLDSSRADSLFPSSARPFSGLYRDKGSGIGIVLLGATGDLHAEDPDELFAAMRGESGDAPWGGPEDVWSADPGPLGGRMECASYRPGGGRLGVCTWFDKGSMGVVMSGVTGSLDRATPARTTRELRRATLRPTDEGTVQ
ncbi:tetratricopeptide repeat protein [Streptomyces sp. NPDC102406]|uniref:tetratricopeptide repeat protein n=1 Tax=Streptomyces sp. NPDC102406 TaxID=3366171 RepID=UPI0038060CFB